MCPRLDKRLLADIDGTVFVAILACRALASIKAYLIMIISPSFFEAINVIATTLLVNTHNQDLDIQINGQRPALLPNSEVGYMV